MDAAAVDILTHALAHAERGWRVHPVKRDKRPILKEWQHRATCNAEQITQWWSEHKSAGVGIATGRESNIVVVDLDIKHDGIERFKDLQKRLGRVPPTVTVKTPTGGLHLYFKYPTDCDIGNRAALCGIKGIDVRGEGGYVVAPPSEHPDGGRYEWGTANDEIAELPEGWRYAMMKATAEAVASEPVKGGPKGPLSNRVKLFVAYGVEKGERNQSLFEAATQYAGAGYTMAEAWPDLERGALKCKPPISAEEIKETIESAYSKPRTPWVEPISEVESIEWDGIAPRVAASAAATSEYPASPPPKTPEEPKGDKPYLANFTTSPTGGNEGEPVNIAKPINIIAREINEACGGHPLVVQRQLLTLRPYDHETIPSGDVLRFLNDHNALFAYLHEQCELHWPTAIKKGMKGKSRKNVTAVSRREMFEHLRDAATTNYTAIEVLPHVPQYSGTFYVPVSFPSGGTGALAEFMAHINAETEDDKALILAALLTPAWGGDPGKRPAFVFTSDHGRGTGKSQTAELICSIYGGRITIQDKDDWAQIRTRLLADESLSARCVLWDNIKHRVSGQQIESLITTPAIDGHKMYVGQYSRPNRLTYFLTANGPAMSQDLADRSVVIKIGKQRHGSDWEQWSGSFLRERRRDLLADIYTALSQPDQCVVSEANRDRWYDWQKNVLQKFENGDAIAATIRARRQGVDADSEDAEDIAAAIRRAIQSAGFDGSKAVRFTNDQMRRCLLDAGITERTMTSRAVTTWLKNLIGAKALAGLRPSRAGGLRCWVFAEGEARADQGIENMPQNWGIHPNHE